MGAEAYYMLITGLGTAFLYWIDHKGVRTMRQEMIASKKESKRNGEEFLAIKREREAKMNSMRAEAAEQRARTLEEVKARLRAWDYSVHPN